MPPLLELLDKQQVVVWAEDMVMAGLFCGVIEDMFDSV